MNSVLKLPMYTPLISGYIHHAGTFSTIDVNNKESDLPWVANNFIQLTCSRDLANNRIGQQLDFVHEQFYSAHDDIFSIQHLHQDIVTKYSGGIVSFLIDSLDRNNYIELMVNEYYINNTRAYMKYNFTHNIFIYGYNGIERVFYARCMINTFTDVEVKYEDMIDAFNNKNAIEDWMNYSKLYKKNDLIYTYDFTRFLDYTRDYLNSKMHYRESNKAYGFEVYRYLEEYLSSFSEGATSYDIRSFHILCEHKKCMVLRYNYLKENAILVLDDELLEILKSLEKDSIIIRNLLLKIQIKSQNDIIPRIKKMLNILKHNEEHFYQVLCIQNPELHEKLNLL